MKMKKLLAAALALLLALALLPAAGAAAEEPSYLDRTAGRDLDLPLRMLVDETKGVVSLGNSALDLGSLLFVEDWPVGEEREICLCEVSENVAILGADGLVMDGSALPAGCKLELRNEKTRLPDTKNGKEVLAEEKEKGKPAAPKKPEVLPEARDTLYLYLTGKPMREETCLFVITVSESSFCLCSVKIVPGTNAAEPSDPYGGDVPIVPPAITEPPAATEPPAVTEPVILPTTVTDPPKILPTPSTVIVGNDAVIAGDYAVLEAQVTDGVNESYQWYEDDRPLEGETNSQYWPNSSRAGTRVYTCLVTNSGYDQTTYAFSAPFTLTVKLPTPAVSVTGGTRVTVGDSAVLEVQATDTFNPSYQWYEGDQPIYGATESRYKPDTASPGSRTYTCLVTNSDGYGETTYTFAAPVTVTVEAREELPTPSVSISGSTKVTVGDSAVLEAHATNTVNAGYQWYEGAEAISGANGTQYRPDTSRAGTQTYSCLVTNSDGYGQTTYAFSEPVTFTVEARPTLPTPTVAINGSTRVTVGENAVLEAWTNNAYNPAFQWYVGFGTYWAPIDDGTGSAAKYRPDTSKAGTWTYCCKVTSSDAYGQTVTATSEPVTFTVETRATPTPAQTRQIASVSIAVPPTKTRYTDGEALDTTGLSLKVQYADGSSEYVSSGFYASPQTIAYAYSTNGVVKVNVNYRGYSTSYSVNVRTQEQSAAEMVRGISVQSMPNKTSYNVGDWLDTTGLLIRAYSYDGRYLDIGEGFECSPTRFNSTGNQVVTVSFAGKTCSFTVAVQQQRRVTGIALQSLPVNRSYAVGDTINTTGLTLQVYTNTGTETVTTGYTISPRVATTPGTQTISVIYEGQSVTYTVDVRSSDVPRATPTPTPTPVPFGMVTPTPSATPAGAVTPTPAPTGTAAPRQTAAPARRNTGVNTAVKVLFAVALLALAGLIGYVVYVRKTGGFEEEDYSVSRGARAKKRDDDKNRR